MPDHLDITLTPAQWEHYTRHGWTLVEPCRNSLHDMRGAPVSEYHCPECGRAPYRSKDGDWYCFDPTRESTCRWRGPNPKVTPCCVPATVPCPECEGDTGGYAPCDSCNPTGEDANPGVVPRVVGIVRPERECDCKWDRIGCRTHQPITCTFVPAERVGTATVTAVPVVDDIDDSPEEAAVLDVSTVLGVCWFWPEGAVNNGEESDVTHLFATPPEPGGTVWRLDRNEDR